MAVKVVIVVCATAPNDNLLLIDASNEYIDASNEYTITRPTGTDTALKLRLAEVADTNDINNEVGASGATLAVVPDMGKQKQKQK